MWSLVSSALAQTPSVAALPAAPKAIPFGSLPGVAAEPGLQSIDRSLSDLEQHPSSKTITSSALLLGGVRLNTPGTAIIVGIPLGPLRGVIEQNPLAHDPEYQTNFAALAALHVANISGRPLTGQSATQVRPIAVPGRTSNVRSLEMQRPCGALLS